MTPNYIYCSTCAVGNGQYISGGRCESCSAHCKVCSDYNHCTECYERYYVLGSFCDACIDNCLGCRNNIVCNTCDEYPNYYL